METTSLFCVVDFDSAAINNPQNAVASAFRASVRESAVRYESVAVEKDDMINEYTETLTTRATVRVEISGLRTEDIDNFEVWLDRRMNEHSGNSVYGIEVSESG